MNIAKVVKLEKESNGLTSDDGLGDVLGVSGVTVGRWRKKESVPEIEHAHALAILAGIDPGAFVLACIEEREKRPDVKATIRKVKATLLAAIVSGLVCILCKIRTNQLLSNWRVMA